MKKNTRNPAPARREPLIEPRGDVRGSAGQVVPTRAGLALVEAMAAEGQDLRTIAKALGCGATTLRKLRDTDDEVAEALARGRAALSDELTHILLEQARGGNTVAAIFLAKARCGWREGDAPEARANIVINLPPAHSEAAYMRAIEGEPTP